MKTFGFYQSGDDYRGFYSMKEVDELMISVWGSLYDAQWRNQS